MKYTLCFFLLWLQLCSCSHTPSTTADSNSAATADTFKSTVVSPITFQPGTINPKVLCSGDEALSFAVYTPSAYKEGKSYPVLILFDPHGDGSFPLNNYQSLADEFSYILIGSNNSKNGNGREETAHILQELMQSVYQKIPVDSQRVYVGGFSGGGRVASMLALSPVRCQGLVTCGASFPPNAWTGVPPSIIVGIAGNSDMNLVEFTTWRPINKDLEGRYQFIRFEGKHEWPSPSIFRQAFLAFEANAMRDGIKTKDDQLIQKIKLAYEDALKSHKGPSAKIYKMSTYSQWIKSLNGLADVSVPKAGYQKLLSDPEYFKLVTEDQALFKEEEQRKAYLGKAVSNMDSVWWNNEVLKMRNEQKSASPGRKAMLERVQGNLSLSIYMTLTRAITSGDSNAAFFLAFLYRTVDPENSEAWYLSSGLYAKAGAVELANQYLEKAISNGFNSRSRILSDQAFQKMTSDVMFNQLLNKITN
ncbi:hypothetical protein BH11BAC2_BH11BAC2_24130 [soil metagenome]